jgi:hypothetical protein
MSCVALTRTVALERAAEQDEGGVDEASMKPACSCQAAYSGT